MKRKIIIFILCGIMLLGICGCNNKLNEQNTNKSKDIKYVLSQKYRYLNTIKCEALNEVVVAIDGNHIVTKNKIYELNMNKLFSNEKNCKEIKILDLDSEIITFNINKIETKNKIYKYDENKKAYTSCDSLSNGYTYCYGESKYKAFFSFLGKDIMYSDEEALLSTGMKMVSIDNKIKLYKLYSVNNDDGSNTEKIKYIEIENQLPNDEMVKKIDGNIIKTNKAYYQLKKYKTNKEQCEKYADIKCQYSYKLEKNKILTENYNNIKYVNTYYIIDKNNNVYSMS